MVNMRAPRRSKRLLNRRKMPRKFPSKKMVSATRLLHHLKINSDSETELTTTFTDLPPQSNSKLTILDLPSELLQKVFSHLTNRELFYCVRPVCRRFRVLAMSPTLWDKIEVEKEVPTGTLRFWIRQAKLLKHFCARHRNDINCIAEEVSKHCKQLESVCFQNCWGSQKNFLIHSTPLCNLITRCPRLHNLNFSQCRFLSCKFFRLISKDNRRVISKKCNYTGPITPKQMKALLVALGEYDVHETATIGNVNLNHRFKLKDVIKYILEDPNHGIEDIWENINYGPNIANNGNPIINDFYNNFLVQRDNNN